MRIEKHVEIDRPPTDVFGFIRDPNNDPTWCSTVSESTQVEGDAPEPGAIYEQVHEPGPAKPTELTVELLEIDAPHHVRLRSTDELGWFDVRYQLEELPDGRTRLTQIDETHFRGIGKLLQPILYFAIRAGIDRQFSTLKRILESGDPATAARE